MQKLTLTPEQWLLILTDESIEDDSMDTIDSDSVDKKKDTRASIQTDPINIKKDKERNNHNDNDSDDNTTKAKEKESHEIVITTAKEKIARGKYGKHSWVATHREDGGWYIRSRIKLNGGQKSSISAKINKFLKKKKRV